MSDLVFLRLNYFICIGFRGKIQLNMIQKLEKNISTESEINRSIIAFLFYQKPILHTILR